MGAHACSVLVKVLLEMLLEVEVLLGVLLPHLQYPSMFPLSSQVIGSFALGPGVQPTGILHSAPV